MRKVPKKVCIKGAIIPNANQWIYDLFGMDATSPGKVQSVLDLEEEDNNLVIEVNSTGGSVFAGSEIYTMLRGYTKGEVTINIVGTACSAAAFISSVPNAKCYISPTASIMWHRTSISGASGNTEDLDKVQNMLNSGDKAVANAFIAKTGKSMNEAIKAMSKETWYSAQEAVDIGLADGIMFEEKQETVINIYNSFANGIIPEEIINKMQTEKLQNANDEVKKSELQGRLKFLNLKGEM